MRTIVVKTIENLDTFKEQLLTWSQSFREVVFLDSNQYQQRYSSFDLVCAVDGFTAIQTDYHNVFQDLHEYQSRTKDWLFGYLAYDVKNDTEQLDSNNWDGLHFPDLFFFQPKKLFLIQGNELQIQYLPMCDDEIEIDLVAIQNTKPSTSFSPQCSIQQRISKEEYLTKVQKMLDYIHRGAIYEANFCMEFFAEDATLEPQNIYQKLNLISKPPFATFFKNNKHYLLCASPERYLRKDENRILSQPIKGTSKRFPEDKTKDEESKTNLSNNQKERSENIMIVDLVRNDLSHTAEKGSVQVEELCGIYTFEQVHQMISTVVSTIAPETSAAEVLKTTFPMGSMTGAPKISAMKIIEELEETKRGLYSGAVGYFTPTGDFDFNVVIRSILYNQQNKYLSFSVGSAITAQSTPEKEYEECLLKAQAMFAVLS